MIKKIILSLLILLVIGSKLYAQTEPMYSQYMYNLMAINPAYAGSREALSFNTFYRKQWVGVDGAPQTMSASMDGAVSNNRIGLGIQLYDDRLGVEKASGFNSMISSRVKISRTGILSGGLLFGMMHYRANLTMVPNRFTQNDPAFSTNFNKVLPSVGLGLFYNTDHYYLGVSSPNILHSKLTTLELISSGLQKVNDRHLFVTSGVVFDLSEDVKLKPSVLMKMVSGAPTQFDFNANIWLKNILGIGASYRTGDAIVGMLELQLTKELRIGYAYDRTTSPLNVFSQGSHELMFRYEFGSEKNNIKSTRYF